MVRCPTCAGQVVVPNVETEETEGEPRPDNQFVFERSDFEDLLKPAGERSRRGQKQSVLSASDQPVALPSSSDVPPGAWGTHAEPAYDVEKINPAPPVPLPEVPAAAPPGIFLSPAKATLLAVLAIIALSLAFGGGVVVGYMIRPAPEAAPASQGP